MVTLAIDSIRKTFRRSDGSVVIALDGFSATLREGEFVLLIGGNGSGKSTLLDILSGRSRADQGQIFFDDRNITRVSASRRAKYVALVPQNRGEALPRAMTVEEALLLALESRGVRKHRSAIPLVRSYLEALDPSLVNLCSSQIWSLSGGEYQLVALAAASIFLQSSTDGTKPGLLLLDEHTAHLAAGATDHVLQATRKLAASVGVITLMATHDPFVGTSVGTRQLMIKDGKLVDDLSGVNRITDAAALRARMLSL